jgi:signal transduction histidine kinase
MPPAIASPRIGAERTLALARVSLALASLFAIWIDPAEPARFAPLTYALHLMYVTYSVVLALFTWTLWRGGSQLPYFTHGFDIVAFSVFQYLTLGPSSPFFVYFIFSLFCGAVRWGWRGTLSTGLVVVGAFLAIGVSMSRTLGPSEFELNRFIIRTMYLGVTAAMLVYLGRYEERLRSEIDRLARWPSGVGLDAERTTRQIVEHAGRILAAVRVAVLWESGEEPWIHVAVWDAARGASVSRMAPDEMTDPLPEFDAKQVLSVHFATDNVRGRLFLMPSGSPAEELAALADVVAREIGASLDQLSVTQRLREIAASEERIRVARDLHDGVLQSLTGIRLELRAIAAALDGGGGEIRGRLFGLERALAIEQRELRFFIGDLKPAAPPKHDDSLVSRLDALRERIALEWKAPVSITVTPDRLEIPGAVEQAVPMMVHEAVVNALKHAQPSRVAVNVAASDGELRIVVSDDGHGFPFKGRYDHAALSRSPIGPRSLFDRVSAFGGRMAIDSSDTGSRIEMVLSL